MKKIPLILILSLTISITSYARKEGGVSSGGGGDDRAHVETNLQNKSTLVCPGKGTFDCDDLCESALDQITDEATQAILDSSCSTKEIIN